MDRKLDWLTTSAPDSKSQIIWFLIYKDKAQFQHQDSDDLSRQSNAHDNSQICSKPDWERDKIVVK